MATVKSKTKIASIDTTEAQKQVNALKDSVADLKNENEQTTTTVKDLKNQLKQLKDTMASTETGTEEYNKALREAAEIQHQLREQTRLINNSAADFGQIVTNSTKVLGGMIAGMQSAKAIMNMFGVENENVIKSLQTMQNLMALTQALPALDNAVKGFQNLTTVIKTATGATKGFKAALVSTGLGALVAALGLLVANWDKVSEAMKKWGIISEDTKKKLEEQRKKVEDLRSEIAKLEGDYDKWLTNNKVEKLNENAKKSYTELTKQLEEYEKELAIVQKQEEERKQRSEGDLGYLQGYYRTSEELNALIADTKLAQQAILDNADSYKELTKTAEESSKKQNQLAIDLYESTRKLSPQSLQKELETKFRDNPITIPVKIEIDEEEELSIDDEKFLAKADELRKNVESVVDSLRKAFVTPEEQYQQETKALELALNAKLISQQEYNDLSEALQKEHNDKMKVLAVAEAHVWMSALSNLGSVFASMADMIDQSTEEGQEKYKALMYTSTIVSMLAGIGGAIASAFMPVNAGMTIFGQIAMAASTSASVLASGIAQLLQIKNANQNSTLGGSGSFAKPNTSAITSINAPVQYTQDVQGASIEGSIKDTRVYVTESDITNTQRRVDVTESEARY